MTRDAHERAATLGAAMLVCSLVQEPPPDALLATADVCLLTEDEWNAWRAMDDDELPLIHACLQVEWAVRSDEFAALELLDLDRTIGGCDSIAVARALTTLGWHVPAPEP
jgi:hypothetical protein